MAVAGRAKERNQQNFQNFEIGLHSKIYAALDRHKAGLALKICENSWVWWDHSKRVKGGIFKPFTSPFLAKSVKGGIFSPSTTKGLSLKSCVN